MRELDWWDIIGESQTRTRFEDFFKNEHHGRYARALDADLREVVFETGKRILNHNDTEDQDARIRYLREARARLN
ncbi:hypothetical protein AB0L82_35350 [Nocardia sp. NPDC052001]|uniref:hypothetical protein n=1 Tax=Nocardia sp. NPDC052001 TaxID=3154853 RepID=UPI003422D299